MEINNKKLAKVVGGTEDVCAFKCPSCGQMIVTNIFQVLTEKGVNCPFCQNYFAFDRIHKPKK